MKFILVLVIMMFSFSANAGSLDHVQMKDKINDLIENTTKYDIGRWSVAQITLPAAQSMVYTGSPIAASENDNYFFTVYTTPFSDRTGCKKFKIIYALNSDRTQFNMLFFELCEALDNRIIIHVFDKYIGIQLL